MTRLKYLMLCVALTSSVLLAGCAKPESSPTPTKPAATTPAATTPVVTTPPVTKTVTPTPTVTPKEAPQSGGKLRVILPSPPGAPLGAEWEGNFLTYATQQWVMQRLAIQQLDGSMGPGLATSWNINGAAITFNLRKGVKFHDGTDFNAQAVKWNLEMFKAGGMFASVTNYISSLDVIDDYTIRVTYTEPRNTLLLATWEYYFFVSPGAYDKNGIAWMRDHMVGTGPFKQVDYQKDVATKTVKFDDYWDKGKPYLDAVDILYVSDELTREASMKSGGAEVLTATPKLAQRFQNQGFKVISRDAGPFVLVPDSLNAESPWSNLKVRQALDYAIDKEALAKTFGYGLGVPAYQLATSSSMAYNPALAPRKYDPVKAKQLLTEAGFADGFKSRIVVGTGLDRDVVLVIQASLAKVGITVDLEYPEPAKWQQFVTSPWTNALAYTTVTELANYNSTLDAYFADPGSFYFKSTKKPDGWKDLYARSLRAPAPDPTILKQVSADFHNDAMLTPLFYNAFVYVMSPKVRDSGLLELGNAVGFRQQDVWLSK